jgi:tetratricopeptide (TPR) repeat protein
MHKTLLACAFTSFFLLTTSLASAGPLEDCASGVPAKVISGCTKLLKTPGIKKADQSMIIANRGLGYFGSGDNEKAIKDLEKAADLNPKNYMAYQGLGFALQRTGLYPEAVAAFDKAIALNPSDHTTISYRGYTHLLIKDHAKALKDFDAALKIAPKNASYHAARGDALKTAKAYPLAIAAYSKAIALDANQAGSYEGRGLAHLATLNIEKAVVDFDKGIKLNPKSSLSYAGRAMANYLRDDVSQGLADAEGATKLSPNDAYMLTIAGLGHVANQDWDKAKQFFEQAQAADANFSQATQGLAEVTLEQGDPDAALTLLDNALLQAPNDTAPYSTRGHIVLAKGRIDEAISNFEKALAGDNLNGESYWGLGLAYAKLGDTEKARMNLEESLKPYRLLPYQRKRAEAALQELATLGGGKSDLGAVAAKQDEPFVKTPDIKKAIDPGKRIALVIGNGAYENANNLPNPTKDSTAVAAMLRNMGFDVLEGQNLKLPDMQAMLRSFAEKSEQADVSLFFYAGHGIEIGGRNYLIPIDAKMESATSVDFELVDVNTSIVKYLGGKSRTGIVMLDSCRNNPLAKTLTRAFGKTRAVTVGKGMAPMTAEDGGLLIAFATTPGEVAEDGEGENSPFTTALLKHFPTPGVELEQMMKRVKKDVFTSTEERQQPWVNSALRDEIYLVGN